MKLMKLGHLANRLAAARLEPVGRGEAGCLACQHRGQAGEYVCEEFLGIDVEAAAVFHDCVEDGALLSGLHIAGEQPVFRTQFGRANRTDAGLDSK